MKKRTFYILSALLLLAPVFIIYALAAGTDATEAEELFRAPNDRVCYLRGDMDLDGSVTAADARIILRFAVKLQKPTEEQLPFANLDGQAGISSADARNALRIAVRLDPGAPHVSCEQLVTQEATCYEVGITANKCAYCGDLFDFGVIPQKQHTSEGWIKVKDATCAEAGLKEQRCMYCDKRIKTEEIPRKNHIFGETQYESVADCTRMREAYKICVNCGYKDSFLVSPGSHTFAWQTTMEPTCTEYGLKEMLCSVCGAVDKDTQPELLTPLGHSVPEYWTTSIMPTATEDGLRIRACTRCGEVIYSEVLPKTGGN
ncbi:MAG: dockerin type I repeat-containing protein [Clostridia bacterium]|nr:dockerin type I repeat-containing protein [Clostridia bacterium]